MIRCRWDRDREDYVNGDEFCRTDDYGDPTYHCTARRACANHVGAGELTCARCIGRARADIQVIRDRAWEVMPVALNTGVDSEAANLAGPAADPAAWSERRVAMKSHLLTWEAVGKITERQYLHARATMEDDDEEHPYTVLTRWEFMIREDYGTPRTTPTSIAAAVDFLDRTLGRFAQDDGQDFALFAREVRRCKNHLLAVIQDSETPERGAPCPECQAPAPRLVREYGHWCESEECERMHHIDDSGDRWFCPRDKSHFWDEDDYRKWVADVYEANRTA